MGIEIVGLASGPLVLALNIIQFFLIVAIVIVAFNAAKRGKSWVGHILALGILFLAAHNVLEVITEVEQLPVALFKTIATLLIFIAVLLFSTHEKERLKLMGYSERLKKEVEEHTRELRESEKRIRGIVETSTDAIISANEKGIITLWNNAAEKIFGYSEKEALEKPLTIVMPEEYRERHRRGFKKYIETGESKIIGKTLELEGLRKNGSKFPIELSLSDLKMGDRHIFTAVIRDITERKTLEEEIKQHHEELRDYAERLEHSNKMKELFNDIMSHDMMNPVTVISGVAGMITEGEVPEDLKQELKVIEKNAKKLVDMLKGASKYAKLDSTEKLDFRELNLNEVINDVIGNFEPLLRKKNMNAVYKNGEEKLVMANPVISDAISNLLSNAIKYGPPNSEIVIEVGDEGDEWLIGVKDSGEGIPDESKEKIFDRFKRIEKGGVKGTGLGLAIVKRIVELHGGRAWVEDNPGGGNIFYIAIPKKHPESPKEEDETGSSSENRG